MTTRNKRIARVPGGSTVPTVTNPRTLRNRRRRANKKRGGTASLANLPISKDGEDFLKAATAQPDFDQGACEGIPDKFTGRSVVKQDMLTQQITVPAGKDTYFVFSPTPGVAYWKVEVPIGTFPVAGDSPAQPFVAEKFPDTDTMFQDLDIEVKSGEFVSNTKLVDQFRYVGMAAELISTDNEMTWKGNITCWKTVLALEDSPLGANSSAPSPNTAEFLAKFLTGMDGVNASSGTLGSQVYSAGVNEGVYSVAMNQEEDFNFSPIRDNVWDKSNTYGPYDPGSGSHSDHAVFFDGPMLGMGDFETIVIKVTVPTGDAMSFALRTWAQIEYLPVQNGLLNQFSRDSPGLDHVALCRYALIARNLPVAVCSDENESFWKRVLSIVKTASGVLSELPGEFGDIARGVHLASRMI